LPLLCVPAWAQSPAQVGELFTSDAGGQKSVQLAGSGMNVTVGSELSAGIAPATLKLVRGGQVRICPRSGLSVNAGTRGLMLAAGVGAVEIDYRLDQAQFDVIVTPDFNVQLIGPGTFHFALGVNKQGDTCVRTLSGNTSEVVLSELLGSSSYTTQANEAALFLGGKLSQHAALVEECGCSGAPALLRATDQPKDVTPSEQVSLSNNDVTAPLPPDQPGQVHVEVDTPFVFNARASGARPFMVAKINFSSLPNVVFTQEIVDPAVLSERTPEVSVKQGRDEPKPAQHDKESTEKKGFFSRVKGFFGGIFHR